MDNFKGSTILSGILLIILLATEVTSLMWKLKPGQSGGNLGTYGGFYGGRGPRGDYGQWESGGGRGWENGGGRGWENGGWNEAWSNQAGMNKGSTFRSCFDSRQCWPGECCRATAYGSARCDQVVYGQTYGCLQPRPSDWGQRPVYPQKPGVWQPPQKPGIWQPPQKPGIWQPPNLGRPGFCPPREVQWRGPAQFCRQDQDCPSFKKCCSVHGKPVCTDAILT